MIFDESLPLDGVGAMIEFGEYVKRRTFGVDRGVRSGGRYEDLLVPVMHGGRVVYSSPSIHQMRDRTAAQLSAFPSGVLRFDNPQQYACGLEESLYEVKRRLIEAERSKLSGGGEGAGV
jgi:nicotinate phosphoribosyltransferase